jgi:hypothetical protein
VKLRQRERERERERERTQNFEVTQRVRYFALQEGSANSALLNTITRRFVAMSGFKSGFAEEKGTQEKRRTKSQSQKFEIIS